MSKEVNLNLNSLVFMLTPLFSCGKNSVYNLIDIACRLVQSAVHNQSLEAMFKLTRNLSADRVLDKLHEITIKDVENLILNFNKKIKLPRNITLAIDFTDKLYYGNKNHPDIIGDKEGNVRRYIEVSCVAPAYVINVLSVNQLTNIKEVLIRRLLNTFYECYKKTKIDLLLIDRGFYSKKVVQLLVENNIQFIMPAKKTKDIKKLIKQFEKGEVSSRIKHKFGPCYVNILFLKLENKTLVYMTNTRKSPLKVFTLYRNRWQIETNFREQNKFIFKTQTNNFTIRYFGFVLASLLFNLWQMSRNRLPYKLESYLFKNFLIDDLLKLWQTKSKEVIKSLDYLLVT